MRKNERGGTPQKERKYLRSDRSAQETVFKTNKKESLPSLYSHAAFCTTTHMYAHTHSHLKKRKKRSGRSYENYYFYIIDDRLEKNSSKHSVFAKASTSILKLSIVGGCGGEALPPGHLVVRLHCGLSYG